jgi:hypothetical protein
MGILTSFNTIWHIFILTLGRHPSFPWKTKFNTNFQFMFFRIFQWTLCYPKHCVILNIMLSQIFPRGPLKIWVGIKKKIIYFLLLFDSTWYTIYYIVYYILDIVYYILYIVFYTILYLPSIVEYSIVAMKSRLVEPTLYNSLYPSSLTMIMGQYFSSKLFFQISHWTWMC